MKPSERIDEVATNEDGVDGVIRYWDARREKFVGHRLDDYGRYWESKNPEFTGIRFIDFETAKERMDHGSE